MSRHYQILPRNFRYNIAGDSQLYVAFNPRVCSSQIIETIEKCISSVKQWMQQNMLKLNDSKTEFIVFGSPHYTRESTPINLTVGDSTIEPSDKVRNLGAVFDKHLSMEDFVKDKIKSALFYLKNIKRIRHCLTPDCTKTLVHAFVTSRLDYANSLLYGISSNLLHKLQVVQNAAARLISCASRFDRATPLLKSLHWLPIEARIVFKILLITHKCLNNKGPAYLSELLEWYSPVRALRSTNQFLLKEHKTVSSFGDKAFVNSAPYLWNRLPLTIRCLSDTSQFKTQLKTHLFTQYLC